jgi:hypothetical protein
MAELALVPVIFTLAPEMQTAAHQALNSFPWRCLWTLQSSRETLKS